jgi:protein required for attachment to host cells
VSDTVHAPIRIAHDAWLMICDGRKAIFATNIGTPDRPRLSVHEALRAAHNPPSREQGTDRPGRTIQSTGIRRSAMEHPDLHDLEEHAFLAQASQKLTALAVRNHARALVLIAPPRALAVLREELGADIRALVTCEIAKDLTKHPLGEMQRLLTPS